MKRLDEKTAPTSRQQPAARPTRSELLMALRQFTPAEIQALAAELVQSGVAVESTAEPVA